MPKRYLDLVHTGNRKLSLFCCKGYPPPCVAYLFNVAVYEGGDHSMGLTKYRNNRLSSVHLLLVIMMAK